MTELEMRELDVWIETNIFGGQKFGLKKRGYWYRPDAHGYTDRQSEAWRLTKDEAAKHEYKRGGYDEMVVVMPIDTPRYTTDPAAALMVLEKCIEKFGQVTIGFDEIIFYVQTSNGRHNSESTKLPIAICLFAKKVFSK